MSKEKQRLYQHCVELIKEKIQNLEKELRALTDSAASDTKSSMGDKYETGREMINLEKGKIGEQLRNAQAMMLSLNSIDADSELMKVELGALVKTNIATYFLSAPLGQVKLDKEVIFCISMGSPIGQQMLGKSKGDTFQMAGRSQEILEINWIVCERLKKGTDKALLRLLLFL